MSLRRRAVATLAFVTAFGLAGCAVPRPPQADRVGEASAWSGRLALRVESNPPQSLNANFDLRGSAESGELVLATPLGSTLARMEWSPGRATLVSANETRRFASVGDMVAQLTGTPVPVGALFEWMAGRPVAVDGWQADLSTHAQGRLQARRSAPAPAADLRIAFEPQ